MKKFLVFCLIFFSGISRCFANDFGALIIPQSYLVNSKAVLLFNNNLEELLGNDLITNLVKVRKFNSPALPLLKNALTTNPQVLTTDSLEDKKIILNKIFGTNKYLTISVKYELISQDVDKNNVKYLEEKAMMTDITSIRFVTKVTLTEAATNKLLWENTYYKSFNFDYINLKSFDIVTNYFNKLSKTIIEELTKQSGFRPAQYQKSNETKDSAQKSKTENVEVNRINHPEQQKIKNSNTKLQPQLKVKEEQEQNAKTRKNIFSTWTIFQKDQTPKTEKPKQEKRKVQEPQEKSSVFNIFKRKDTKEQTEVQKESTPKKSLFKKVQTQKTGKPKQEKIKQEKQEVQEPQEKSSVFNIFRRKDTKEQTEVQKESTPKKSLFKKDKTQKTEKPKQEKIKKEKQKVKKSEEKSSKGFFENLKEKFKNSPIRLEPAVTDEEFKRNILSPQTNLPVEPVYTNIQVKPRQNSRNYTPEYNTSVNDI